ncbi:OLC1v1038969C1 [Oldenlandia corymbosa var. corymbosa]|uniref:OLC1v1038969C1 n=1 Tax=Oldenlandia corymbosa var. corymbosa TaxID=529605 RepID=A0AAV1D3M9_OLDCO|nr:OLC1v1038969C1 [Oldenlandia corymbosa var. corymbosa]
MEEFKFLKPKLFMFNKKKPPQARDSSENCNKGKDLLVVIKAVNPWKLRNVKINPITAFPFHNLGRRFYSSSARELQMYVNSGQVARVLQSSSSSSPVCVWLRSHKSIAFGILFAFTFTSLQWIPLSGRTHWAISEAPVSIRVVRILTEIFQATHQLLGLKNDFQVSGYVPSKEMMIANPKTNNVVLGAFFKFPKKGLNWEVMVVDSYTENAAHFPNGKIMIYARWLEKPDFTDADVATVLDKTNGLVYFTDSSTKYPRKDYGSILSTRDNTRRLLVYDPRTRTVRVHANGLMFSNGVALSQRGDFILVTETTNGRVLRYWLRPVPGKSAGMIEPFAQLLGNPDNIRKNQNGDFWVAMNSRGVPNFTGLGMIARSKLFLLFNKKNPPPGFDFTNIYHDNKTKNREHNRSVFRNALNQWRLRSVRELQNYVKSGQVARVLNPSSSSSPVLGWLRNHKLIGFGLLFALTFTSLQWIPVSGRIHLVLSGHKTENLLGNLIWEYEARENCQRILGAENPMSIRVARILREILQATHQALGLKNDFQVSVYVPRKELQIPKPRNEDEELGDFFKFQKKVRDYYKSYPNQRVQHKPLKVRKFGIKYGTQQFEGLNWEVMVIDDHIKNAAFLPNGKIVFHAKWLKNPDFTDADVAAVLGHEVGHGLARHASENLLRALVYAVLTCLILPKIIPYSYDLRLVFQGIGLTILVINAFISRRRELEADQIGMMLMAAAGYDPRHAPEFYEKNLDFERDIMSTHPPGKARAEKLRKVNVVRRAEDIYNQVRADVGGVGHGLARRHSMEPLLWFLVLFSRSQLFVGIDGSALLIPRSSFFKVIDAIFAFISRREMEADRIGMMLMAAAGYDPRRAPECLEKYGPPKSNFKSHSPTGKERAEKLRKDKVRRKAEQIYNKVRADGTTMTKEGLRAILLKSDQEVKPCNLQSHNSLQFRTEIEADRIGLPQMAVVGFDPRLGPQCLEKYGTPESNNSQPPLLERKGLMN